MIMSSANEIQKMALFCDFENVARGVRDAKYADFDIRKVLERLLVKGDIVVKKAYCDWERYKDFKHGMHGAAFELIEIPNRGQSGKNSADIRMVVDALDLCYTKAHVDAFVIISGDSDFSPLVSKLRENNKTVIGVGVRNSTSDLLVKNCDEFIFNDDLVKADEARKKAEAARQQGAAKKVNTPLLTGKASTSEVHKKSVKLAPNVIPELANVVSELTDAAKHMLAIELVVETVEALMAEKERDVVHASLVKSTLKRRRPDFVESAYGYKGFGKILDDAAERGLLELLGADTVVTVRLPRG